MNEWLKILRANVGSSQVTIPRDGDLTTGGNEKTSKWGVKNDQRRGTSAGWGFDVKGITEVRVIEARQNVVNGLRSTEFFLHIFHNSGMSWRLSRGITDILSLHEAFKNTNFDKFTFLDKIIQMPREATEENLTAIQIEQHKTVIRVYIQEALKQAVQAEYEFLEPFFSPTATGFDEHRGHLVVWRYAVNPCRAQRRWCALSAADRRFWWSADEDEAGLSVSTERAILVVRADFLPSTLNFEIIVPQHGVRLCVQACHTYDVRQWVAVLRLQCAKVVSDIDGLSLTGAEGSFSVAPFVDASLPWLGAQTADASAVHRTRRTFVIGNV